MSELQHLSRYARFDTEAEGYDRSQVDAFVAEMEAMLGELEETVRSRGARIRLLEQALADGEVDLEGGEEPVLAAGFDWSQARSEVQSAMDGDDDESDEERRSRYVKRAADLPRLGIEEQPKVDGVFKVKSRKVRYREED